MNNFTTNNYEMKREIVNFSKKITEGSNKAESKFVMDMIYGIWDFENNKQNKCTYNIIQ